MRILLLGIVGLTACAAGSETDFVYADARGKDAPTSADDASTDDDADDQDASLDSAGDTSTADTSSGDDVAPADGGATDSTVDTAPVDSGADTGPKPDSAVIDTAVIDTAVTDTGVVDTGVADTGVVDTGVLDTGTVDDAGCKAIAAAAEVDPWSMRPPSAGFGGITGPTTGTHKDVFLDSPTKYIRVGARLNWGGTVVFFGMSADAKSNVIDANDTGRELQIALYDPTRIRQGCAVTASCATSVGTCGGGITYLGWNPVQGGDECNRGAPVLSHGRVGDALELVVQPLQWNPDWDAPDCRTSACSGAGRPVDVTYRMRLRFVREHVVEVDTEVTSKETFGHPATGQEWPTMYVSNGGGGNPDLPLFLDAAGTTIGISTPDPGGAAGIYYQNFTSPAPWVTWQKSTRDYGVGLGMDQGLTTFQGWRGQSPGPYFHNVRANVSFGLAAGAMVRGMSYLALGSYATIKTELEAAAKVRAPFGHVDVAAGPIEVTKGTAIKLAGWALDNRTGTTIEVQVDGAKVATAALDKTRADVCAVYPGYLNCPKPGFEVSIPTTGWSSCPRLVRVLARDSDGNVQVLGEREARVK